MNNLKTIKINNKDDGLFFTSDTHFGHSKIIEYCNRPFSDVYDMDRKLIENWNNVVKENDTIFILGDFCFGNQKYWKNILSQLNGKKYLCKGNHDKSITRECFEDINERFNIIVHYDTENYPEGQRITVDHYPLLSWYQKARGSWQLFGHVHGNLDYSNKIEQQQIDVGVDSNNYRPISYDEVKQIINFGRK